MLRVVDQIWTRLSGLRLVYNESLASSSFDYGRGFVSGQPGIITGQPGFVSGQPGIVSGSQELFRVNLDSSAASRALFPASRDRERPTGSCYRPTRDRERPTCHHQGGDEDYDPHRDYGDWKHPRRSGNGQDRSGTGKGPAGTDRTWRSLPQYASVPTSTKIWPQAKSKSLPITSSMNGE